MQNPTQVAFAVLLVEDNPADAALVRHLLADADSGQFLVDCTSELASTIDYLAQQSVDVLLLDLRLGDSDGIETFRRVHAFAPDTPTVILTGLRDRTTARTAIREGAQDYLFKDELASALLVRTLRYAIDRKRTEKRLLRAERLSAIGEMVTGLAHESRNALQRSQAALSMLENRLPADGELAELVAHIQAAQDDLHHLYEEVRQYAAPATIARAIARLDAVVQQSWEKVTSVCDARDVQLTQDTHGHDLQCMIDEFAIEQVFRNLFENSLAASPDSAQVRVDWSPAQLGSRAAWRGAVRDGGPGLTDEQRRRLFEPFYTTKTRGTGLGLAIVKRLIEAHGGTIEVGPGGECGTEFIVTLPCRGASA